MKTPFAYWTLRSPYLNHAAPCVNRQHISAGHPVFCRVQHILASPQKQRQDTGQSYEHRRQRIKNRARLLSSFFTVDICAYAVMSNQHLLLRRAFGMEAGTINAQVCWESRFKSRALLTDESLLSCMTHVDLKPVQAGHGRHPAASDHTCIWKRTQSKFNADTAIKAYCDKQASECDHTF
jgi:hypothetical protein